MTDLNSPSALAQLLQQFFLQRLSQQRNASPRTVAAYRDTMRLLLQFAEQRLHRPPERLTLCDIDAPLVLAFLNYLEVDRHSAIRSRNLRLAAVRAFLRYVASKVPESARHDSIGSCDPDEALRATPDRLFVSRGDQRIAHGARSRYLVRAT